MFSRDYSQALDVGTFSKGLDSPTIRILVWILGFMSFGYATGEFEVYSLAKTILIRRLLRIS
jgi:Heterokaryon incompatibility protein Het-C